MNKPYAQYCIHRLPGVMGIIVKLHRVELEIDVVCRIVLISEWLAVYLNGLAFTNTP